MNAYLTEKSSLLTSAEWINDVRIELYTDKKEPATELRLETVLDNAGIFYNKTETWIESEKLYEVLYTFFMEVNENAQE